MYCFVFQYGICRRGLLVKDFLYEIILHVYLSTPWKILQEDCVRIVRPDPVPKCESVKKLTYHWDSSQNPELLPNLGGLTDIYTD